MAFADIILKSGTSFAVDLNTSTFILAVDDGTHDHFSDFILLFQAHFLILYSGYPSHSAENVVLENDQPIIELDAAMDLIVLSAEMDDVVRANGNVSADIEINGNVLL